MSTTVDQVKFVDLGLQYRSLRDEIVAKIDELAGRGEYILSGEVEAFEREFAEYCGTKYALGIGKGSDALFFLLKALGVGPGDEVITAPNSFIASAWVIAHTGAKIVFADVDYDFNIKPEAIEAAITARTKAILPVHLTGRVARMNDIQGIADKHNLKIVEDAAQAVGARYKGRRAGSFGAGAGFSLHPLKNLHVMGDGGALTTNDQWLYEKIKQMRNHGLKNRDECEFWGYNSRLDAIQAGIARIKLKHLDRWNDNFRRIAAKYTAALSGVVTTPPDDADCEQVFHRYVIRTDRRDELQKFLTSRNIESKINYPIPLHLQEAAKDLGYKRGDFPVAEELCDTILSLPIYAELEDGAVDAVITAVQEFYK